MTEPFGVRVVDLYDDPIQGVEVSFVTTLGSASVSPAVVRTGVDGVAQTTITLPQGQGVVTGDVPSASQIVEARVADLQPAAAWFYLLVPTVIDSFTATPSTARVGDSVTLSWDIRNVGWMKLGIWARPDPVYGDWLGGTTTTVVPNEPPGTAYAFTLDAWNGALGSGGCTFVHAETTITVIP